MDKLNTMGLTANQIDRIKTHQANILRYNGVKITINTIDEGNKIIKLFIEQIVDKQTIYNTKELHKLGETLFNGLDYKIQSKQKIFVFPLEAVTIGWINNKAKELGLNQKSLSKVLHLNQSQLSKIQNGKTGLTDGVKAAFYYLFKYLELNKSIARVLEVTQGGEAEAKK